MADLNVVMEKLHSFETADDLAEFFRGYGIKAVPCNAKECVISRSIMEETGAKSVATSSLYVVVGDGVLIRNTPVMALFVGRFDGFRYMDLVEKSCLIAYNKDNNHT